MFLFKNVKNKLTRIGLNMAVYGIGLTSMVLIIGVSLPETVSETVINTVDAVFEGFGYVVMSGLILTAIGGTVSFFKSLFASESQPEEKKDSKPEVCTTDEYSAQKRKTQGNKPQGNKSKKKKTKKQGNNKTTSAKNKTTSSGKSKIWGNPKMEADDSGCFGGGVVKVLYEEYEESPVMSFEKKFERQAIICKGGSYYYQTIEKFVAAENNGRPVSYYSEYVYAFKGSSVKEITSDNIREYCDFNVVFDKVCGESGVLFD